MNKPSMEQLNEVIACILMADRITIHGNRKNKETRRKLGISIVEQENMVKRLKPEDWVKGPESNHDLSKKEDVWVFKKEYNDVMMYIKFYYVEQELIVETISCHIDNI